MIIKRILFPTLLLLILFYFIMPGSGFTGDLNIFKDWSNFINLVGLGNIYYCGANYPPGYFYILKFHSVVFGTSMDLIQFSKAIKMYPLVFDLIGIIIVLIAVEKNERLFLHWMLLGLNISFLYNTIFWGQIDGIPGMLNFAAIYCAFKKRTLLAILLFILGLNFKLQGIILFPVLFLILITNENKINIKKIFYYSIFIILTEIIILIPFLHIGKLKQVFNVVTHAVDYYPVVSCNAANFWNWVFSAKTSLPEVSDQILFAGLSLRNWGFLILFLVSLIAFYPLIRTIYFNIKFQIKSIPAAPITFDQFLLAGSLPPLLVFYFSTQMHERYSHNCWLFIAAWSFGNKKYIPFILFSLAYLSNMENVLQYFQLNNYHTIFWNFRFASALYGLLIIYLIYQMYLEASLNRKRIFN